jgi:hypothetical protein
MTGPPAPFVPAGLQGKPVVAVIVGWFGDLERGERVLEPLRAFGPPAVDIVQPMPYVALQSMLDNGMPRGRRHYWRSDNLRELPDEAIDTLCASAASATSPLSQIILGPLGGALADVPEDATALGGRGTPWMYHCYGGWEAGEDRRLVEWVREAEEAMRPYAAGKISLNFVSDASDDRVRAAFGAGTYKRLAALKDRYDPDNVFRLNQNIRPSR